MITMGYHFDKRQNISVTLVGVMLILLCQVKALSAPYTPADPILNKQLQVIVHTGGKYCYTLVPRDSAVAVITDNAYGYVDNCSKTDFLWSFDINGRLSTSVNGLDYCLTLPESVLKGTKADDYVIALRCDLGNRAQQWYLKNGDHFQSLIGGYRIKDRGWYLMVSNDPDEYYDHSISTDDMAQWLKNASVPRSYNLSTDMNWHDGGSVFYANYRDDSYVAFRTDRNNSYRVFYSPRTKLLAFQHFSGDHGDLAYCMVSNSQMGDKTWRYTSLSSSDVCPNVETEQIPKEMQWTMVVVDLPEDKKKQARVKIYDSFGNPLKIWKKGSSAWGLAFTAPNGALPSYESMLWTSEETFYVNREVAEWARFYAANELVRTQYCPAPSSSPQQLFAEKKTEVGHFPPEFQLNDDWYLWLAAIARSPIDEERESIGLFGDCFLQTVEILRELYESGGAAGLPHYFDPSSRASALTQYAERFPDASAELEQAYLASREEHSALFAAYRIGEVSLDQYYQRYRELVSIDVRAVLNMVLPDFYASRPHALAFNGFSADLIYEINHLFGGRSVGTSVILSSQVRLLASGRTIAHSSPLVRFTDGWVVLDTSAEGVEEAAITAFNRQRFQTPAEAVLYYFQHRVPFNQRGQNNIDFSYIGSNLVLTEIEMRPLSVVVSPVMSFDNCTGEGEDGRRGSPSPSQGPPRTPNYCVQDGGASGRCYGY